MRTIGLLLLVLCTFGQLASAAQDEPKNGVDEVQAIRVDPTPPYPATRPSITAGRPVAFGMLIAGAVGWLALGGAFLVVLNRQANEQRS